MNWLLKEVTWEPVLFVLLLKYLLYRSVSVENSGSVSGVPNDFRAVSGYSIIVQDEVSGLYGQFYIESDTHTFTNGKAQMDLTLAFENLMDEEEIEKDTNNKKSK